MTTSPPPDRVTAIYDALDAFQREHRIGGGLGHAQIRALLAEHLDRALPAAVSATDRAAAPVKQRADCTELEWAEQERARFERLYTRETVRADKAEQRAQTAVRDADIYRQRLERLGEGYTRERQRADQAEAEAERLRTDRTAACICGHTEAQHFEDACLVCDCGDYLTPGAAREVIDRQRKTADHAGEFTAADLVAALRGAGAERDKIEAQARAADRAAVLREAADELGRMDYDTDSNDYGYDTYRDAWNGGVMDGADLLRRMADETQPPTNATARCGQDIETALGTYPCERDADHSGDCDERTEVEITEQSAGVPQSEVVHGCPPDGSGLTPCCGPTPFELPLTDRISSEAPVTCPGPTVGAQQPKETRP